jgi:acyl-CoA reductase-like NAD-dependent aldehyde dehydrogenase
METTSYRNVVNGRLESSSETFNSLNPATDEVLGTVPVSTPEQIREAVAAAKAAQPAWAALPDEERKSLMMRVAKVLEDNTHYLADLITREQGKPLAGPGSVFEMQGCIGWTQVPASLDLPVEVAFEDETRRDEVHRKPIGVIAAIAPWNWPLLIAIWQIIPSIRAGNTVVIKPSEHTPIGTLEMVRLISEVLPAGVVNTVTGDGKVGQVLCEEPDVDKIMFTGSSATGARIIEASAKNLARVTLELGGNDAAIVLPDVDAKAIAEGLFWGAFINMGQTCACAKRLYVHEDIHDEIVEALKVLAEAMPMGNGLEDGVVLGPVQNRMQFNKVCELVEDARTNGATFVSGGQPGNGPGNFFPITLVTDIDNSRRLVQEEQFGPVLPIIRYRDVDDAILMANAVDVGLGASVWSSEEAEARKVADRLEAGTVWINQHGTIHPMVPFGGAKKSGFGVEFGVEGLKAVTQPKVISVNKSVAA